MLCAFQADFAFLTSRAIKIIIIDERRHVPILVNDPQDHRRALGSLKAFVEDDMTLTGDRAHAGYKQAPIAADLGSVRNALEGPYKMAIIGQPLITAPCLDGVGPDVFKIVACKVRKLDRHARLLWLEGVSFESFGVEH